MFNKKNKQEKIVEAEVVEETIEEKTPFQTEDSPRTNNRDNPASFFDFSDEIDEPEDDIEEVEEEPKKKKRRKVKEEPKKKEKKLKKSKKERKKEQQEQVDDEVITMIIGEEPWIWSDNEETILKREQEAIQNLRKGEEVEETAEKPKDKKELSAYFEDSKNKNKKLKRSEKTALNKSEKENKGKKHKKSKKDKIQEDIKNQKAFRYDGKKYTKVEDFITYLNAHYLDIEEIAEEILEDENFFGWINNNSGVFAKSLKEFKEIKAKIENKS